jgi:hypothetical protein
MPHDPARRACDPDRQLDQPLPQRGHLGARAGRPLGLLLQRLEQDVGRGGQQDADLIGQEARAAGPAQPQAVLESARTGAASSSFSVSCSWSMKMSSPNPDRPGVRASRSENT